MTVKFVVGDTRDVVSTIPDGSVDLIITSPPFLALRSYLPDDHPDKAKELGSEPNPAAFIDMLLALTAEWRRVLAPHGTLAVELGDTYSGSTATGGDDRGNERYPAGRSQTQVAASAKRAKDGWPLAKSQALIPELYRVALAYGINPLTGQESPAGRWRVRNTVTWCRPNPPVGQLGDKFRPSTSDLVIACTSERRWFDLDAVRTPHLTDDAVSRPRAAYKGSLKPNADVNGAGSNPAGAPPLDHWIIPPGGYTGSHYAVFPPALVEKPIEACCPRRVCTTCGTPSRRITSEQPMVDGIPRDEWVASRPEPQKRSGWSDLTESPYEGRAAGGLHINHNRQSVDRTTIGWTSCDCPGTDGIRLDGYHTGTGWRPGHVLDPFGGSGTTGLVASGHSRDCTLIDLDERNADLARERLGMFLEVEHHQNEGSAA